MIFNSRFTLSFLTILAFSVVGTGCQDNTAQHSEDGLNTEIVENNEEGFRKIFDGETLAGWKGDTSVWRVENNSIVGEVTAEKPLRANTFLIWQEGTPGDFELKAEVRITVDGNSGINYRSELVEGVPFGLKGYQADMDGKNTYTGLNYEERGRGFLAKRGETAILENGKEPQIVSSNDSDSLLNFIKNNEWNEMYVIAKGNHLKYYINGVLMSDVTDNDTEKRKAEGLLGLQAHVGPPMTVEYRNIRIKN